MTTTDGRSQLRKGGRELLIPTQALVLRFWIELQKTDPSVWREIEVPGDDTFWDLHVAIQDAMGWLDYHLHRFTMPVRCEKSIRSPAELRSTPVIIVQDAAQDVSHLNRTITRRTLEPN